MIDCSQKALEAESGIGRGSEGVVERDEKSAQRQCAPPVYGTNSEICKIVQPAASEMGVFDLMDAFLASLRLDELEETHQSSFHEVDRAEAGNILTYLLSYDLVHGYRATSLSEKQVATIVERFLTLFSSHPRYFTNGEFNFDVKHFGLRSWSPLTSHTFDTGLILVDEQRIGILWEVAEDELNLRRLLSQKLAHWVSTTLLVS